ncbi:MAG TPA: hypothetical protein VF472_05270 [Burkholderiaceae bacterium]
MQLGFIMMLISAFIAGIAWLVAGAALVAWAVGIAVFLFALLGGLSYAFDTGADDDYRNSDDRGNRLGKSEFGGRCISGSWR